MLIRSSCQIGNQLTVRDPEQGGLLRFNYATDCARELILL